ncbi:MAG: hypothetical protein IT379_10240 [Deltaproteobacteria bacterium]|nr:hypothetical protein [Deltaproteobacteria bacterium]
MTARASSFLIALAALGLVAACKPDPVVVQLRFPSQQMFLQSEFARIAVVDLAANDLGACPRLVDQGINDSFNPRPVLDSGATAVCNFRSGGVTFDEIDEGPKAFVGIVREENNTAILAGCAIGEAYNDAPTIDIVLTATEQYRTAALDMLTCSDIEDKCERGCR